jgi:hypothetical protein
MKSQKWLTKSQKIIDEISKWLNLCSKMAESLYHADEISKMDDEMQKMIEAL